MTNQFTLDATRDLSLNYLSPKKPIHPSVRARPENGGRVMWTGRCTRVSEGQMTDPEVPCVKLLTTGHVPPHNPCPEPNLNRRPSETLSPFHVSPSSRSECPCELVGPREGHRSTGSRVQSQGVDASPFGTVRTECVGRRPFPKRLFRSRRNRLSPGR